MKKIDLLKKRLGADGKEWEWIKIEGLFISLFQQSISSNLIALKSEMIQDLLEDDPFIEFLIT